MALFPTRSKSGDNTSGDSKFAVQQAAQQDVFLREVDDALREDEFMRAVRTYGKPVGAVVVAGLLGLAGWLWYSEHNDDVAGKQGETFTQALDQVEAGRISTGRDAMAPLAKDGNAGYQAAARLMEGGIALQQNKPADAGKLFAAVAADSKAPQAYRDLATIREVAVNFDKLPPQQVVDRLRALATPGNPWFGSAGEMVGVAYMKLGKNDQAGPLFAAIAKDKEVPDSLRRRARQLAGLLGVDAVEDAAAAARTGGQ